MTGTIASKGRPSLFRSLATQVPVVQDQAVDPAFGSGAVMICTFGDKQDVHWWKQHNLPLRKAIDRTGKMTEVCRKVYRSFHCRVQEGDPRGYESGRDPQKAGEPVAACRNLLAL